MSECETVQESIERWLDGEIKTADSGAVQRHLEGCRECAAASQRLQKLQTTLSGILKAEASQLEFAPFWHNVRRRIDEKRPWHEGLIQWAQSIFTAPRLAWAVPVAIVLVLGLLQLNKRPFRGHVNSY